jgi:DNA-directed RNA polymerase specialized sigma24 family protein
MRKAVELRALEELSNRDTALHLGVSIGAVKARVFHARRKLAKALRHHMRPYRAARNRISIFAKSAGALRKIA